MIDLTFSALATLKPQAAGFVPTLREGTEGVATIPTRADAMETEVRAWLSLWLFSVFPGVCISDDSVCLNDNESSFYHQILRYMWSTIIFCSFDLYLNSPSPYFLCRLHLVK